MSLLELRTPDSAGAKRTSPKTFVAQAVVITTAFLAYLGVRSLANGSEQAAFRHAGRLLEFEAALGLDIEQRLQAAVLDMPALISFFNFVYAWTYWPFIIGAFVITWFWRRPLFTLYRNAMMISGATGLVLFVLVPVAPPRFLAGFVDTVGESARSNFIGHPDGFINEFAALPSFHVGWVALASAVLSIGADRRWVKVALLVPTMLMAFSVVITANHYVVDIVAGVGVSLLSLSVATKAAADS